MTPFKVKIFRTVIRIGEPTLTVNALYKVVKVVVTHTTGTFTASGDVGYMKFTFGSGPTVVKAVFAYQMGNKKEFQAVFSTDKFALITATATLEFGNGTLVQGTVPGISVTGLPALDAVYTAMSPIDGTETTLNALKA